MKQHEIADLVDMLKSTATAADSLGMVRKMQVIMTS